MIFRAFILLIISVIAAAAAGRVMLDEAEQKDWNAVGRLNVNGGFCTGALIEPDLVVTAAHCVYVARTGAARLAGRYILSQVIASAAMSAILLRKNCCPTRPISTSASRQQRKWPLTSRLYG